MNRYQRYNQTEKGKARKKRCIEKEKNNPKAVYSKYKRAAKQRNIKFSINLEDFKALWGKNCVYCGIKIATIGVDRIENTIGYEKGNITSCCWMCNKMKGSYSAEEFIEKCRIISNNQGGTTF